MNPVVEERFVKNYIVSARRDRLLFELSGKKRRDGIGRFCHHADELLMKSKIISQGQYIDDDIQRTLSASGNKNCYVISMYEELDGKEFGKAEALELIIGRGMPSIAIFDDFAIVETEQESGPAVKYLMRK